MSSSAASPTAAARRASSRRPSPGSPTRCCSSSYPLHPPGRRAQLRTAHFPEVRTPALFIHGSADPFGSLDELESARKLIPALTSLLPVEGAGHDLYRRGGRVTVEAIVAAFLAFVAKDER